MSASSADVLAQLSDEELQFSVDQLTRVAKVLGKRLQAHPCTRAQLDAALSEQMMRNRRSGRAK